MPFVHLIQNICKTNMIRNKITYWGKFVVCRSWYIGPNPSIAVILCIKLTAEVPIQLSHLGSSLYGSGVYWYVCRSRFILYIYCFPFTGLNRKTSNQMQGTVPKDVLLYYFQFILLFFHLLKYILVPTLIIQFLV